MFAWPHHDPMMLGTVLGVSVTRRFKFLSSSLPANCDRNELWRFRRSSA